MGFCCPVAKVSFFGDLDSDVEEGAERNCSAKVACLYFHNSHTWKHNAEILLAGGFCGLHMSRAFIAGDTYEEAIQQGRVLLHEEKSVKADRMLGNTERAFVYMVNETDWSKCLPRLTWNEFVDPAIHVSTIVRLYYCVSVQLGISRMAAPFDIHYNDNWLMSGSVPNPHHEAFMQEESVLVGGFADSSSMECQQHHKNFDHPKMFVPVKPDLSGLTDVPV